MNKQKTLWCAFTAAFNETPMGFFRPAVMALSSALEPIRTQDARRKSVALEPIDPKNRKK